MHTLRGTDTPQGRPHCLRAQSSKTPRPFYWIPLRWVQELVVGLVQGRGEFKPIARGKMDSADVDQPSAAHLLSQLRADVALTAYHRGMHSQTYQEISLGPSMCPHTHRFPHQSPLKVSP